MAGDLSEGLITIFVILKEKEGKKEMEILK